LGVLERASDSDIHVACIGLVIRGYPCVTPELLPHGVERDEKAQQVPEHRACEFFLSHSASLPEQESPRVVVGSNLSAPYPRPSLGEVIIALSFLLSYFRAHSAQHSNLCCAPAFQYLTLTSSDFSYTMATPLLASPAKKTRGQDLKQPLLHNLHAPQAIEDALDTFSLA